MVDQVSYRVISADDPQWLQLFWYYNGYVTIVINSFGVYMILWHSSKDMIIYKYFLLQLLFWCFIVDMLINWFFCPGFLLPLEGIYMSTSCVFGKTSYDWIWLEMISTLVIMENLTTSVVDCFLYRLWIIEDKEKWWYATRMRKFLVCALLHGFYSFSNFYTLYISRLDRSVQEEYIRTYYPNSLNLLSYTNWVIIPSSIGNVDEIMLVWLIEIIIFHLIVAWVIFQIIRLLRQYTFSMSPSTLKAHRHFVRALFIQAFVPFMVYTFPVIIQLICVFFGFHGDLLQYGMIAMFSLHSQVNVFVMLFVTKPYRLAIQKALQRTFPKTLKSWQISIVTEAREQSTNETVSRLAYRV